MKITNNKILIFISFLYFLLAYKRPYKTVIDGVEMTFISSMLITEDTNIDEGEFISNNLYDINILVVDGATLTITPGRNISKIVSKSIMRNLLQENTVNFQETNDYKFGLTSTIVAIAAKVNINGATIYVDSDYSNAIMAFNGATVTIKNSIIITKSNYSKGIVSSYNSYVDLKDDTKFYTYGFFSPCLEINKNKGQIIGSSLYLYSEGEGSPLIKGLGDGIITLISASGNANHSQILIIQGNNEVSLNLCEFICNGQGYNNTGETVNESNNIKNGGIVLHYKEEPDNNLANLYFFDCKIRIDNEENIDIPMFSCYDIIADVILSNTEANFKDKFMQASTTNSNINTLISLEINDKGFIGKINAEEGTKITLKIDQNLLSQIEINEKVDVI